MTILIVLLFGYLLGSIPFGLMLTRAAGLGDVRNIGSGNIGATNVLRTGNKGLAAATLLLDGLKGAAAVVLARTLWIILNAEALGANSFIPSLAYDKAPMLAGLGAFLGHIFPVWLGFKGGKGVATYIGVLLALYWPAGILFCVDWLAVAYLYRFSSLAALVAAAFTPVTLWLLGQSQVALLYLLMTLLLFWAHRENISGLMAGTESKIGGKTKVAE